MKLLVDTNVLIKALIKNSMTRGALLSPSYDLFVPEYAFEEVEEHMDVLVRKTGLAVLHWERRDMQALE